MQHTVCQKLTQGGFLFYVQWIEIQPKREKIVILPTENGQTFG